MTDIALSSGNFCRPLRTPWGGFHIRNMPISTGISSNKIYIGACVGLDVNSTLLQDSVVPSSMTSNTIVSTAIVGIAAANPTDPSNAAALYTSTVRGTLMQIPVWDADPSQEFVANTRNGLLNSTIVGQPHDLLWDSTLNILLVNVGASCLGAGAVVPVLVTQLIDNSGDSGGRVAFKFCARDVRSSLSTARLLAFWS